MAVNETIETLLKELKQIVKSETVFGDPLTAGDSTIIPVSKISFGFAAGGSGKSEGNSGTGGGVQVIPVAIIIITDGKVQVHQVDQNSDNMSKLMGIAPDLIETVWKKIKKNGDEKESKK